jgi:SAM-dependent methyltransferase
MDVHYGERKRKLLADHPQTIVEIGAAYGANFRYLRPDTKVIVIEPNDSYYNLLQLRARYFNIEVEIHNLGAEAIELPSGSVDMVFGSLVLCTVDSPVEVLKEVHRILKKEGQFVFLEHVKAERHSWICRIQNFLKRPWKWFFDGCHVTRNTDRCIQEASFDRVDIEEFNSKTIFVPIIPHVSGIAVK